MGRVAAPFAVRGWIRVQLYTEQVDSLVALPGVVDRRDGQWQDARGGEGGGPRPRPSSPSSQDATTVRRRRRCTGCEVAVPRSAAAAEPARRVLLGRPAGPARCATCRTRRWDRVERLLETGANQVLVVRGEQESADPVARPRSWSRGSGAGRDSGGLGGWTFDSLRRRHAVPRDVRRRHPLGRDAPGVRERCVRAGAVEPARFQHQCLSLGGRPALRRRARHGDDARAAGEGVAGGASAPDELRGEGSEGDVLHARRVGCWTTRPSRRCRRTRG